MDMIIENNLSLRFLESQSFKNFFSSVSKEKVPSVKVMKEINIESQSLLTVGKTSIIII